MWRGSKGLEIPEGLDSSVTLWQKSRISHENSGSGEADLQRTGGKGREAVDFFIDGSAVSVLGGESEEKRGSSEHSTDGVVELRSKLPSEGDVAKV